MSPLTRILFVSEPGKNGVFVVVRDLIRHLHQRHPEITVDLAWSSRRQLGEADVLAAEVRANGGETLDLHVSNAPEAGDLPAAFALWRLIRRRRPQIIHAHSSKAGALVRLLALLPGMPPVFYTPHAYYGVARAGGRKEAVYNALEAAFGRIGTTLCCSEDERDFARDVLRLPARQLEIFLNGINTDTFSPASPEERAALRARLGLPADARILATIGRDTPQKNYGPLYAALDRGFAAGWDFHFAHAGEGSPALVGALADPARGHAYEHLDAPADLLRAADGFILPSRYEGLALTMLEALACGLPCLLSDAPGFQGLRHVGLNGIRWLPAPAAPDFEAGIERAIADWLTSPPGPLLEQVAQTRRIFDRRHQLDQLIALYRAAVR